MGHGKVKVKHGLFTTLRVVVRSPAAARGRLQAPGFDVPCAIGRAGVTHRKREGDGASPTGAFAALGGFWRQDRMRVRPLTALPLRPNRPSFGWCDAPDDHNYNRLVALPYPGSHEDLWREDGLYDVVIVLDWNHRPRQRGRGSAIFLHLARPGYLPTAGCVALSLKDMRRLLPRLTRRSRITIG